MVRLVLRYIPVSLFFALLQKKKAEVWISCLLSHVCSEVDSRSLPYNVSWDGPGIQEVTLVVSIATLRSAVWGRRPLLKHKGPLAWINTHGPHTHLQTQTRSQGHKSYSTNQMASCVFSKETARLHMKVQLLSKGQQMIFLIPHLRILAPLEEMFTDTQR